MHKIGSAPSWPPRALVQEELCDATVGWGVGGGWSILID